MADCALTKKKDSEEECKKYYEFGYNDGYDEGWTDGNSCDPDEPTESEVEFYCRLLN